MSSNITLYTSKICPFCHRVELALAHAGVEVTKHYIDLSNKPEWYISKINADGKVPLLAYGGVSTNPEVLPENTVKLVESAVLLEFINDLYPEAGLLPADPVGRAKARLFIDTVGNTFVPAFVGFLRLGKPGDVVLDAVVKIQNILGGSFAVGDQLTIADISLATFIARAEINFSNDIGAYPVGEGKKLWHTLLTDEKYSKFAAYWNRIKEQESFKKSFDREAIQADFAAKYKRD